jgi:hypothetical protein
MSAAMREDGITVRAWQPRDRESVQGLLRLLSQEAEVRSTDAPTYVAESGERVVGMVTLCVFGTLTGPKAYLDVGPEQVVQAGDGCLSPEGLVSSVMVVGKEPAV